jgi:hypothetical protein
MIRCYEGLDTKIKPASRPGNQSGFYFLKKRILRQMTTDRSNHTTDKETCQQNKIAREYILNLMKGMPVLDEREIIDRWEIETGEIETYSRGCEGNVDKLAAYLERCCKTNPELAELLSPVNHDKLAREALLNLRKGIFPENRQGGEFGPWEEIVKQYERKLIGRNVTPELVKKMANAIDSDERLTVLLASHTKQGGKEEAIGPLCPPLPDHLQYPPELAASACKWLDDYIAFSKKWSPRGYEGYHEAVGISLLATVAARRVTLEFGGPKYTPMFMALVGTSTLWGKTTTIESYHGLLKSCGLDWLLGADIITPQKLLSNMAGNHIPTNYDELTEDQQIRMKKRLAFAGQVGWCYDEFGMQLDAMVKENGIMSEFKGLLRKIFDGKKFSYDTIKRSLESIEKPYLSLIVSMTQADIKPHAAKGNKFWKDGLWPRFMFVCPPKGAKSKRDRFPDEELVYPPSLISPIVRWHYWLGEAEVVIEPEYGKDGTTTIGHKMVVTKELPQRRCILPPEIKDAVYSYADALKDMIESDDLKMRTPADLIGCYGRLHMHALHIAMLLASVDNQARDDEPVIELRHWARARQFVEERRKDLHEMYAQVNVKDDDKETFKDKEGKLEDDILAKMVDLFDKGDEWVTAAKMYAYLKKSSRDDIQKKMQSLVKTGELEEEKTNKAIKFKLS